MNIVGIDPSLISTAITINGNHIINYTKEKNVYKKKGIEKWYGMCEPYAEYKFIKENINENFTSSEISKMENYNYIIEIIIEDIYKHVDNKKETMIIMEGYSYSSASGPLIDLVTFGTLLRNQLRIHFRNIQILPPSTLKLESAKLTYEPILEGKKTVYRNKEGIAGGKFDKFDMYKCLTENKEFHKYKWVKHLCEIQDEVFSQKSIKKPIDDITDSFLLYLYMKNNM